MWWWLDRLGLNPESIQATSEDISALTFTSSPFDDEEECLVVFPKGKINIDPDSKPQNQIVLIVLSDYDGTLSGSKATAYKKYATGKVKQIDWNQVTDWKTILLEERPELEDLLEDINSPLLLDYVLRSNQDVEKFIPSQRVSMELFSILGTKEAIKRYGQLTRADIYSVFLTPDRTKCAFYTLLVKGYGRNFGLCTDLWQYFDLYLNRNLIWFKDAPELLLKKFAIWMYLTNTYYATRTDKGLFSYKNKVGKTIYLFKPSQRALTCFHSTSM
jgi:hypothetical protein